MKRREVVLALAALGAAPLASKAVGPGKDPDAPPLVPPWGKGTAAGRLSNSLWTPARDAKGVANQASWDLVPLNTWIEVAGTRLDSLDAVVKAANPKWRDWGNGGWNAVIDAWNGMCWDTRPGYERGWLTVAGGHNDSSNDGIYRLDLRRMAWGVQRQPTDVSWWPQSYINSCRNTAGGSKMFTPAQVYYDGNNANAEGVFWDEFYTPGDPAHSPRTPTARHTYGSTVFVPTLGASGRILMGAIRYWEYDLATDKWAVPKFPFGNQAGYDGAKGYTGENMIGWWNAQEERYYICATQNYDYGVTWSCLSGGTGWRWEGKFPSKGYESQHTAQEQLENTLWTLLYNVHGSVQGMPLLVRETTFGAARKLLPDDHYVKLGSSFAGKTFVREGWDGGGMTYVPELGKWLCNVMLTAGSGGHRWAWITTSPSWVVDLDTTSGSPPALRSPYALETKIKYFPGIHTVVVVGQADQNVRIMRLA